MHIKESGWSSDENWESDGKPTNGRLANDGAKSTIKGRTPS
ncbi:MAG: hypothetical protein ACPMAG_02950 [Limisphaerales bacterium]